MLGYFLCRVLLWRLPMVEPVHQCRTALVRSLRKASMVELGPLWLRFLVGMGGFALAHALAAPQRLLFAQSGAFVGRQSTHDIGIQNMVCAVYGLKFLDGAGIAVLHV